MHAGNMSRAIGRSRSSLYAERGSTQLQVGDTNGGTADWPRKSLNGIGEDDIAGVASGILFDDVLQVCIDSLIADPGLCLALLEALRESTNLMRRPPMVAGAALEAVYGALFSRFMGKDKGSDAHKGSDAQVCSSAASLAERLNRVRSKEKPTTPSERTSVQSYSLGNTGALSEEPEETEQLPWFPLTSSGDIRESIFMLLDDPTKSFLGKCVAIVVVGTIAVGTISFVMESMPTFREHPAECAERIRDGRPLTVRACEPKPRAGFYVVDIICTIIFTVEYALRLMTIHAVSNSKNTWDGLKKTLAYGCSLLNVIDLMAILPFYLETFLAGAQLSYVKVLRFARILRVFKIAKHNKGLQMLFQVMKLSGQPFTLLLFFNVILVVLFGSLIFFVEGQEFSVAPEYTMPTTDSCGGEVEPLFPVGVFIRRDKSFSGDEITPYRSIPVGIWWVLVTMSTVGYGDMAPTSVLGKSLAIVCFYVGILVLAMPIGVLSLNFELVYGEMHQGHKRRTSTEARISKMTKRLSKAKRLSHVSPDAEIGWLPQKSGIGRRIFLVLDDPSSSRLGKLMSFLVMMTILISTTAMIVESMPGSNVTPDVCFTSVTLENCKPVPYPAFVQLETACIIIFTIDYVLRVATVGFVTPDECGLHNRAQQLSALKQTGLYCLSALNIVDLLAIAPFYLELLTGDGGGVPVLRVLRLIRVFRLLKAPKLRACADMFLNVVADALPALISLFFLTCLFCVFFASLMVFAEGSDYSVDSEFIDETHPYGSYVRVTADGHGLERTPYISILYSFWWFFTTATTVGYGDDYPTSSLGRIVAIVSFYVGIVLFALPMTVVGGSFNKFYPKWLVEFQVPDGDRDGVSAIAIPPLPDLDGTPEPPQNCPPPPPMQDAWN